jgi:hypothetical protein
MHSLPVNVDRGLSMRKGVVFALALAAATARAQGQEQARQEQEAHQEQEARDQQARDQQAPQQQAREQQAQGAPQLAAAGAGTSDLFERACVDLLHGRTPQGERAIESLKSACADLMAARAEDRIEAEQLREARERMAAAQQQQRLTGEGTGSGRGGQLEPARGTGQPEQGTGILAAFENAAGELVGRGRSQPMGYRAGGGPITSTLVTNPVGWFDGLGVNAEFHRSFEPKFSWVGGARYANTDVSNGTASTFGAMAGVDWYVLGRNNEGLRVGPRVEVAAGREDIAGEDTTFARMGLGGEIGYNFVASNGLTALVAGGLGGRVAGDEQNEDFASFVGGEFGPFLKLGLGYSF